MCGHDSILKFECQIELWKSSAFSMGDEEKGAAGIDSM